MSLSLRLADRTDAAYCYTRRTFRGMSLCLGLAGGNRHRAGARHLDDSSTTADHGLRTADERSRHRMAEHAPSDVTNTMLYLRNSSISHSCCC